MVLNRRRQRFGLLLAGFVLANSFCLTARAADPAGLPPVVQKIEAANTTLDLMVNTSRILSMDGTIPKAQVGNPELLDFTVLSENQVQLYAKKPGITSVNLWDAKNAVHTVDVVISGDVRELDRLLKVQFPTASLKLFPTAASTLIIFGYVDRPDYVNRIVRIAEDYYPKVINNMTVGGTQQVLLYVQVMQVSRTKLRNLGIDLMGFSGANYGGTTVSGLITKANATTSLLRAAGSFTTNSAETMQFGLISGPNGIVGIIEALKQDDILKVMAEPKLATVSGRPASCNVGGEVAYPMPTGFGNISVAFKKFGTQIDFVPIVLGNGGCRLEVRPRVSEVDYTLGTTINGTSVPGFRVREADTGVELKFGQTLAIAGLLSKSVEQEIKGIPGLMDMPYLGALFRRTHSRVDEVELLIMVRPELVEGLDPDQVPPCGPGSQSSSPSDHDLFWKGHNEVPIKPPGGMYAPGPNGPMGPLDPAAPLGPAIPPNPSGPRDPADAAPTEEHLPLPAPTPPAPSSVKTPAGAKAPVAAAEASQDLRVAARSPRKPSSGQGPVAGRTPDSYNPSNPQTPKTPPQANSNSAPPGFIGPTGYDVRN